MIFFNNGGIADKQISFKYIGVAQKISCTKSGRYIVGFIVKRIFKKLDHRIFIEQLIKLLGKIAANDIDFCYIRRKTGINQTVNNPFAVYPNKRFWRVERDRNKA